MVSPKLERKNSPEESLISKAFSTSTQWTDKDELLDVVYWGKQFLALFIGVLFGLVPIKGLFGIIAYVAISTVVAQQFVVKFHKVDEEEIGGFWELGKEGFGAAFATFMVSWICIYSVSNS